MELSHGSRCGGAEDKVYQVAGGSLALQSSRVRQHIAKPGVHLNARATAGAGVAKEPDDARGVGGERARARHAAEQGASLLNRCKHLRPPTGGHDGHEPGPPGGHLLASLGTGEHVYGVHGIRELELAGVLRLYLLSQKDEFQLVLCAATALHFLLHTLEILFACKEHPEVAKARQASGRQLRCHSEEEHPSVPKATEPIAKSPACLLVACRPPDFLDRLAHLLIICVAALLPEHTKAFNISQKAGDSDGESNTFIERFLVFNLSKDECFVLRTAGLRFAYINFWPARVR
mmetsp:Transcript_69165/g.174375  ORF Transcript_69165/g.174375 Transcript_69165/m.174375 type:complete len:290 (-) Transcript_69165:711-1580(-)